jgi:hypothetical protein
MAIATKPLFQPGRILMSPGAVELMQKGRVKPSYVLARHLTGDWGDLDAGDKRVNDRALNADDPLRIFSSYDLCPDEKLWIITERDRSVTTLLLPEEY